jgi:hypothetical protein
MTMDVSALMKAEIGRRMANWGYAQADGGSLTAPGFSMFVSNDVRAGPSIPVLQGEAEETDQVLRQLREPQRVALVLQHVSQPPIADRHRKLGLTNGAYYRLVTSAHRMFWNELKELRGKPWLSR